MLRPGDGWVTGRGRSTARTRFFPRRFPAPYRPIVKTRPAFAGCLFRSNAMSKSQHSNKQVKKQAVLNPKEKKAAKQAKKHAQDVVPFITR